MARPEPQDEVLRTAGQMGADATSQSCPQHRVVTMLSGPADDGHNGHAPARQRATETPRRAGVRCRRCSKRKRRGEALVSEWFVSEGRYTDTLRIGDLVLLL
jgi:hypothetical protein